MDFERNRLRFYGNSPIQLKLASNGHLILPIQKDCVSTPHHLNVVPTSERSPSEVIDPNHVAMGDIRRLHFHPAHWSLSALLRILRLPNKLLNKNDVEAVVQKCPRRDSCRKLQTLVVSSYVPPYPAHTIRLDIFYLPETSIGTAPHLFVRSQGL